MTSLLNEKASAGRIKAVGGLPTPANDPQEFYNKPTLCTSSV